MAMMSKRNIYTRLILVALIAVSFAIHTKDKKATSYGSFYDQLARSPYAIALFYDKSKENMRDPRIKEDIKELGLMFHSISEDPEYKDADLLFIQVDVSRADLSSLVRNLRINQLPAVQLFVGREAVNGATIQGSIAREQVHNLIDKYLRKKIDEYLKDKDAARARELERAKIRAYNNAYWGPYWYGGYGYPYWGGYYGPGYGFYYGW